MGKAKPSKLSSRKLILSAFKDIENKTGFHIIDAFFTDTYCIATGPKDSICQFRIKEIPKFLFGVWDTRRYDTIQYELENDMNLWSDYLSVSASSELIFFAQYERDIDKFKPSYSGFVQGAFRLAWYDINGNNKRIKVEDWFMDDFIDILIFMNKHPIKSYCYCQVGRDGVWDEISGFKALREYIGDAFRHNLYKHKHNRELKKNIKIAKEFVKQLENVDYIVEQDNSDNVVIRITDTGDGFTDKDVNIIDKFKEKYYWGIDLSCWFCDNKKLDEDLHERFYGYANDVIKALNSDNPEKELEELYVSKIIESKLSIELK